MKTRISHPLFLFALLLVAGGFSAKAQVAPFPSQNASWSVYSFSNYQSDTLAYYLEGDTLLYGDNWSKLFRRNLQGETNYCGAIRDSNGIVEIKLPEEEKRLLYDFTLAVGDTFPYPLFHFGWDVYTAMVVEQIDTVQLANGEFRREIVSNMVTSGIYEEVQERWIEGIGSIHGPLFPLNPKLLAVEVNEEFTLVCFSENDELLYHNPRFASCLTTTNVVDNDETDIYAKIYPNPFTDFFTLDNPDAETHLMIYDCMGRVCMEKELQPGHHVINMQNNPAGIYIVCLICNGKSEFYKIIKNE